MPTPTGRLILMGRRVATRSVFVPAVFVAAVALAAPAQAQQRKPAASNAVAPAVKGQEADGLQQAYILLAAANGDADGHRDRALKAVEAAYKALVAKGLPNVQQQVNARQSKQAAAAAKIKAANPDAGYEVQALSDLQMGLSSVLLQQLAVALDTNKQAKVLSHVKTALNQINLALRVSIKGHEAEVLKEAYILLAAANKDYAGHRATAMDEVEAACKLLDASILKKSTVEQRVKVIQDDRVAAVAKQQARNNTAVQEDALSADTQLYIARVMLQEAAVTLTTKKQAAVLKHVQTAIEEVQAALQGS